MSQSLVRERSYLFKGGYLASNAPAKVESLINGTRQRSTVTVTAANLATTVTIDSTAVNANAAAATKTTAAIAEELAYAIEAAGLNVFIVSIVSNVITLESLDGDSFTIAGTTNCSVATPVAAAVGGVSVPFGCFVVADLNNQGKAKLPHATGGDILGCAIGGAYNENLDSDTEDGYAFDDVMNVCYQGEVWVKKEAVAMTRDDDVYIVYSGSGKGYVRDDNTNADAATFVRVLKSAAATDEYVLVAINI